MFARPAPTGHFCGLQTESCSHSYGNDLDENFPDNISEVVAWLVRNQDAMDIVELYRRRVVKVQQVETEIDQKHGIGDFFRE